MGVSETPPPLGSYIHGAPRRTTARRRGRLRSTQAILQAPASQAPQTCQDQAVTLCSQTSAAPHCRDTRSQPSNALHIQG